MINFSKRVALSVVANSGLMASCSDSESIGSGATSTAVDLATTTTAAPANTTTTAAVTTTSAGVNTTAPPATVATPAPPLTLSAEGPYEGLSCEIAARNRSSAVTSAEQAVPGGEWTITQTMINHNFTTVLCDPPLPSITMPEATDVQTMDGDFYGCDTPAMIP